MSRGKIRTGAEECTQSVSLGFHPYRLITGLSRERAYGWKAGWKFVLPKRRLIVDSVSVMLSQMVKLVSLI